MFSVYWNGFAVYEWSKKEKKTENGFTLNKQVSPSASCKYKNSYTKKLESAYKSCERAIFRGFYQ